MMMRFPTMDAIGVRNKSIPMDGYRRRVKALKCNRQIMRPYLLFENFVKGCVSDEFSGLKMKATHSQSIAGAALFKFNAII